MAEEQQGERTEPATPKRRREAREKGEVAQSRDLSTAFVLGAAFLVGWSTLGMRVAEGVMSGARLAWGGEWVRPSTVQDYHALLLYQTSTSLRDAAPALAILLLAAVLAPFVQIGPLLSGKALAFRGSKIDPIKGFKRFVEPERLFELAKALFKLGLLGAAAFVVFSGAIERLFQLFDAEPAQSLRVLDDVAFRMAASALVILIVLGIADYAWVRLRFERRLRMSRQDVREEMKQTEGRPEVKAQMRRLQSELSRSRMIAEVANADVVVRNPTHYAVALRYERGEMAAPMLVAKGRNQVALRILEEARRHGVPVVENPPIARLIYRTAKLGREVPESLYDAVAEILAYVYRIDRGEGARHRRARWEGGS
ncbi:MAG: flagellar biosynthesis protein FlhB [Myxococcota bacterium]